MRSDLVVPLLFAWALIVVRLTGPIHLEGGDQGKSAQYVLYAWNTGDLLVPLEKGRRLPTKPPLSTWVGVGAALLAGSPSELALRLPSAAEGLLLVALTVLLARRLAPMPVPLLAGLAAAGNTLFLKSATIVRPDMLLALLVLGALLAAVRALEGGKRRFAVLGAFLLGLGVLTKGPVVLLLVGGALVPWVLLRPDRPPISRLAPIHGLVVLLATVGAWAVPAWIARGRDLWQIMVVGELARHAAGAGEPVWQYLLVFPGRFLPWVVPLPFGLFLAWRQRRAARSWSFGLPFCWFVFGFAALCLVSSKRADYLVPLVPAGALLSALAISRHRQAVRIGLALGALFLVGSVVAYHGLGDRLDEPAVVRSFTERVVASTPAGTPLLVHRPGTGASVILFYLGRSEPASREDAVLAAARAHGRIHVVTSEQGEEALGEAGLATERLLMESRGSRGPPLLLLEAHPSDR